MLKLKLVLLFIIGLVLCTGATVFSQDIIVERSVDKVIIDGQVYYVHNVKQGETVYSICRAYNITPKLLSKDNPSLILGLKAGMVLKIQESQVIYEEQGQDMDKFYYHNIEAGETIYSISRLYNIEVESIMEANPNLDMEDIPLGAVILVPRIEFQPERQEFFTSDGKYFFYKVREGETFHSISRSFGISLRSLRKANRKIFYQELEAGVWIKIPRTRRTEEFFPVTRPDTLILPEEPVEICEIEMPLYFSNSIKLGLMLPLYLDQNDEREYIDSSKINDFGKRIYKTIRRDKNWIYPRSYRFIEFYEGALLAVDKLRKRGLNVELYTFDTGQNPEKVRKYIEMGFLDDLDLLIGPVFSMNVDVLSSYIDELKIPIVSPFVQSDSLLAKNPYLFQVRSSHAVEGEIISQLVSIDHGKNIVLVHVQDSVKPYWVEQFRYTLLDSLSQYEPLGDIVLKEVVFSESRRRHDTINEIRDAFLKDEKNIVIVLSEKETFVSSVLGKLNELAKEFDVQVIGFPEWQKFRNIELDYFHDMGIYICSSYYLNYENQDVKEFLKKYRKKYKTEPVPFSFAWNGYDITYYFLSGLATYEDKFMNCFQSHHPDLLVSDFKFKRRIPGWGISNINLYLLKYTKDYQLVPYILPEISKRPYYWELK